MKMFLILMLLLIAFEAPAVSQQPPVFARYWVTHEGRDIEVYGYKNAKGAVVWEPDSPLNARPRERKSEPQELPNRPIAPPEADPPQDWRTNGVSPNKVTKASDTYTSHTQEAAKFVERAMSQGAKNPKTHVTVIGTQGEQARVLNDINTNPAFDDIRDSLLVQAYAPGDWPINASTVGFVTGKPSIYVQADKSDTDPLGGRVIFRARDYSIGAEGLAQAIRKSRPGYEPEKDPDPAKVMNRIAEPAEFAPVIIGAVVIAVICFLPKKGG